MQDRYVEAGDVWLGSDDWFAVFWHGSPADLGGDHIDRFADSEGFHDSLPGCASDVGER